jgi:hypothetical protein
MSQATSRESFCSAICATVSLAGGIELFGGVLLALNFLDGFYKLAKPDWHAAYQIAMSIGYIVLSVRLVQLILAFRGE